MNQETKTITVILAFGIAGYVGVHYWLLPGSHWAIGLFIGVLCAAGAATGMRNNQNAEALQDIRDELKRRDKH